MNFLDKIKIKTGISQRNNFDLSSDHITTSDFFRVNPVHFIHTVPTGKYNIKASTFTRLSAMTNPVLGRCTIHNRAFFVPNEIIMHCWNAFISDSPYSDATTQNVIPSKVTTFTAAEVVRLFNTVPYTAAGTSTNYDYIDFSAGGNGTYKLFSALGRRCHSILLGLGYKIPYGAASKALQSTPDNTWNVEYNSLPLLAFFKVYKDWYANQSYNQYQYDEVFFRVNGSLNYQDIDMIFGLINLAMYDKDYFTAAWDRPVSPNSGVESSVSIRDISNDVTNRGITTTLYSSSTPSAVSPSTPSLRGATSTGDVDSSYAPRNITQFMVDQLKALTDYMKRNQLVGAKYADRLLARFGVRPSDAELHLSIPIGSDETLVQISDVMATATGSTTIGSATHNSLLGDYAGKGVGFGKGGFYYESNDYGIIIIVSTIIPKVGYVQGSNRFNTMYKNRLDFFTPEFDGKSGVQAIREDELKSDWMIAAPVGQKPDNVFGFIPRWADMKIGFDNLSGDFAVRSRKTGMDAWHLFRLIPDLVSSSDLQHNENFTRGNSAPYDRIFAYTGSDYDHFILIYNFQVSASLPMSKLFDSYEFDGGKELTMEIQGKQLN